MKINFNKPFLMFNGTIAKENGKPQYMKDIIAQLLFNSTWENKKEDREKTMMVSYALSQRIYNSDGEIELTVEEAALIKEVAALIGNGGGYAQVINLIEKGE